MCNTQWGRRGVGWPCKGLNGDRGGDGDGDGNGDGDRDGDGVGTARARDVLSLHFDDFNVSSARKQSASSL